MSYQSPIDLITIGMNMRLDGEILKTVQKVGVNVDKEELIRALAYDRDQYERGYKAGHWARDAEIVRCKDCIWFHKPDAETKKSCKCNYHGCATEGDRYCWWGEKDA